MSQGKLPPKWQEDWHMYKKSWSNMQDDWSKYCPVYVLTVNVKYFFKEKPFILALLYVCVCILLLTISLFQPSPFCVLGLHYWPFFRFSPALSGCWDLTIDPFFVSARPFLCVGTSLLALFLFQPGPFCVFGLHYRPFFRFSPALCVCWDFTINPLCQFHPDLRLEVIIHKQCK